MTGVACQQIPKVAPQADIDLELQEVQFWQHRKKLVKESDLYQVFETAIRPERDSFEVFQVVCDQGSYCSFRSRSSSGKTQKMGSKDSAKLFNLLTNLPVSKGETGASVDSISCRRFKEQEAGPWRYYCSVAIPVGLVPHTSLPISELPD